MITYSWKINTLNVMNVDDLQKVIILIEWERVASAIDSFGDIITLSHPGRIGLDLPDPNSFVPLEQLSKETVESWIYQIQTPEDVAKIDKILEDRMNIKLSEPVKKITAPWDK